MYILKSPVFQRTLKKKIWGQNQRILKSQTTDLLFGDRRGWQPDKVYIIYFKT